MGGEHFRNTGRRNVDKRGKQKEKMKYREKVDGGTTFFRNANTCLPNCESLHSRKL
jgi:hypothetical protein